MGCKIFHSPCKPVSRICQTVSSHTKTCSKNCEAMFGDKERNMFVQYDRIVEKLLPHKSSKRLSTTELEHTVLGVSSKKLIMFNLDKGR